MQDTPLSALPGHWLIVRCCGKTTCHPSGLLPGALTVGAALRRFRCRDCGTLATAGDVVDRADGKGRVCVRVDAAAPPA